MAASVKKRKGRRKKRTILPARESVNDSGIGAGFLTNQLKSLENHSCGSHFRNSLGTGGEEDKVDRHL